VILVPYKIVAALVLYSFSLQAGPLTCITSRPHLQRLLAKTWLSQDHTMDHTAGWCRSYHAALFVIKVRRHYSDDYDEKKVKVQA